MDSHKTIKDRDRYEAYLDLCTHPGFKLLVEELTESVELERYSAIENPDHVWELRGSIKAKESIIFLQERSAGLLEMIEQDE